MPPKNALTPLDGQGQTSTAETPKPSWVTSKPGGSGVFAFLAASTCAGVGESGLSGFGAPKGDVTPQGQVVGRQRRANETRRSPLRGWQIRIDLLALTAMIKICAGGSEGLFHRQLALFTHSFSPISGYKCRSHTISDTWRHRRLPCPRRTRALRGTRLRCCDTTCRQRGQALHETCLHDRRCASSHMDSLDVGAAAIA